MGIIVRFLILASLIVFGMMTRAQAAVFYPETFTLDNGMQVVLVKNHRVPVVRHMVWYKVGSADEPKGVSGMAHYFEHLMFKGTPSVPDGQFSKIVARNGGRDNAFTSYDFTAYHQTVAKDRLELVMKMEADRMRNLTLTADIMETERQVVLEERRQRTDNDPAAQLGEQLNSTFYMNHPYGTPVIGWEHEIRAITLNDLKAFYDKWYQPNNAVLVVEGDLTMAELRPLAEKYYGAIPRGPELNRQRPSEPTAHADRHITKKDARVQQPYTQKRFSAPSYRTQEQDAYALLILEHILGGGANSRLNAALVVDQKIAVGAGFGYHAARYDDSALTFWASPRGETSLAQLDQAIDEQIALLLDKGVAHDEVERAKKALTNEAAFARDRLGTAAYYIGSSLATGLTLEQVENWPAAIQNINRDDVNRVIQQYLKDRYSVSAHLQGTKG